MALDFDKSSWDGDALAFTNACRELELSPALERSRSGNGAHVWLFFDEAIPAGLARRIGSHLLTETMEDRPDIGLDSYDRMFPNQDSLPRGGFGNLIALPLQKLPRSRGNSGFLDEKLAPWPDQWAFLANVKRISRLRAEAIAGEAERRGRIVGVRLPPQDEDDEPWAAPPSRRRDDPLSAGDLPQKLELVLGNQIYVAKDDLHPGLRNRLLRSAAFQNPEFYKAQAMRLSTYDKPRVIACAEDHPHHVALPRGCLEDLRQMLRELGVAVTIRDERSSGRPLLATFRGELRPEQRTAAEAILRHDTGVLAATTAFGKTVVAASLIASRGVNTLVLVHRRQLLEQWLERLATFLDLPVKSMGRIGGGKMKPSGLLDIALIQSVVRKGVVADSVADYGHLIVDECRHISAQSFEQVARQAKSRFVLGLSATVTRKDGHHPIVSMQCGPIRHRVDARSQAAARPFEHYVLVQPTSFLSTRPSETDRRLEFQLLYRDLIDDERRNQRICDDVVESVDGGRSPLVLTERNHHLDRLEQGLDGRVPHLIVLRAGLGKKQRQAVSDQLAAVPVGASRAVLATGRYVGEGFDDPRLDTLFLTLPVSWRGTVAQYAGRLHRLHDSKREVRIYDYADLEVPMLARMFDRRCRGYEAIGYTVVLPASAIPGWPADVVLPSDPVWKRDYSDSGRARSATEAFLFRRLETLTETKGRLRLNVKLPIPFDSMTSLEVDLLCADARVAVELDGPQHLADPVAYRRDRRKDQLLQENGYLVLRFLAEDVGEELDLVLDSILRSLSNRSRLRQVTNQSSGSSQLGLLE